MEEIPNEVAGYAVTLVLVLLNVGVNVGIVRDVGTVLENTCVVDAVNVLP